MPNIKSAAIAFALTLVGLFLFVRFAPATMRDAVGLNAPK